MKSLMRELYPLNRSLTGEGVRQTLRILQRHFPLTIHEIPTGTKAFDWTIPQEWKLNRATLKDVNGKIICDTDRSNLEVVGYSERVRGWFDWEDLQPHLHTLWDRRHATPYVTSYFKRDWGFCMPHAVLEKMQDTYGQFHVNIDTELFDGSLTLADGVIPGETNEEIFLSSYVCHPSLANNELSGIVVLTHLVKWWIEKPRRYTLRVLLAPETLGALAYLNEPTHTYDTVVNYLQENMKAGFVLTCLGGPGAFLLQSGRKLNYAERIVSAVMFYDATTPSVRTSKWQHWSMRASDERQFCAPCVDLPVVSIRKTSPPYPEYHNSDDNLDYVTGAQLEESLALMKSILTAIERDKKYLSTVIGEPMLSKCGLYETTSKVGSSRSGKELLDVWSYCDGRSSLEIAGELNESLSIVQDRLDILVQHGIVKEV